MDVFDLDDEAELAVFVWIWMFGVELKLVANAGAAEVVVEFGYKAAGTNLVGVLAGGKALDFFAIMGSCDVHGDGVVVCRCSLDRCQLAELAEETIDPFLDLFIGRCWRRNFDGDAVVARDVHGRTNDNNCVED